MDEQLNSFLNYLWDNKETLTNQQYIDLCNYAMEFKKIKSKIIIQTQCDSCGMETETEISDSDSYDHDYFNDD